jgi:hypothetical protein
MYTDAQVGDYHRPLLAGTYTLNFTAPGYVTQTVSDVVTGKRGAVRVDVQLERDTHFVQRQFGHVRYAPGEPNIVRLDMNIAAGAQPHALIVTETLPAGWIYQAGTTRGTGGTDMDEPRLDGDACSWLFWDTTVRDQTFSYRATAPAGNPGTATFHGLLDTAAEQFATGGVSAWLPLAANETLLRFRYGWNLFSVPTIPDNPSVPALLGTAVIRPVWGWSGNAFVKAETLATKQGYWGYATQETGVVYAGTPEPNPLRRFVRGWNLFGALADLRLTAERTLPGPAHYWDGNYQATLDLKSRLGYWIYSSVDQDVNLR